MPNKERVREALAEAPAPEYFNERAAAGWRLVGLEWERDLPDGTVPPPGEWFEEVPYGLRVSEDCARLVENPDETETIVLALNMIVEDCPLSAVADELNRRGRRRRAGNPWTAAALFDLLPRMIDVSPRLFGTRKWTSRRERLPIARSS